MLQYCTGGPVQTIHDILISRLRLLQQTEQAVCSPSANLAVAFVVNEVFFLLGGAHLIKARFCEAMCLVGSTIITRVA